MENVRFGDYQPESDMCGGTVEARLGMNIRYPAGIYWHIAANYEDGHTQKSYGADAGIGDMSGGK